MNNIMWVNAGRQLIHFPPSPPVGQEKSKERVKAKHLVSPDKNCSVCEGEMEEERKKMKQNK